MCGNFGFLGKQIPSDDKALLPARVVEVFQQMGRETEIGANKLGVDWFWLATKRIEL